MKDIKGYEGLYGITSYGKVWSYKSNRFLTLSSKNGYKYAALSKNGEVKQFRVHRLVAEAYLENPNNLPCVNHKDENKENNSISNLEWCDYSYNNNYGERNNKVRETRSKRTKLQNQKDFGVKIRCIETGEIFDSQTQAAEKYGLDQGNISRVCRGKAKTTGGYHWEFVKEGDKMNDRKEIIEMLYLLKEQAFSVSNEKNMTVLDNISHESFDFVITSAIAKLKEDGGMWNERQN